MWYFRAVAFDLDGTLAEEDSVHVEAMHAIEAGREQRKIILVTGRSGADEGVQSRPRSAVRCRRDRERRSAPITGRRAAVPSRSIRSSTRRWPTGASGLVAAGSLWPPTGVTLASRSR